MSCSSPPAEGRFSDSSIAIVEETLNICRMTQSMIDIAANNLFGLRQYQTSGDLIQKEICECEVFDDFFLGGGESSDIVEIVFH